MTYGNFNHGRGVRGIIQTNENVDEIGVFFVVDRYWQNPDEWIFVGLLKLFRQLRPSMFKTNFTAHANARIAEPVIFARFYARRDHTQPSRASPRARTNPAPDPPLLAGE